MNINKNYLYSISVVLIRSYNQCILAEELNNFLNTLLITVHETAITARYVNYYDIFPFQVTEPQS